VRRPGLASLSPTHLANLFRAGTGESPHRWLMRRRLERARELLENPSVSIIDIAHQCGFVSSRHLASVTRKRLATTATDYRRELLGRSTRIRFGARMNTIVRLAVAGHQGAYKRPDEEASRWDDSMAKSPAAAACSAGPRRHHEQMPRGLRPRAGRGVEQGHDGQRRTVSPRHTCTSDDENAATPRVERSVSSGHIQIMLRPDRNRKTLQGNAI
jgi:AraC-like DNA-binding protein